MQSIRQPNEHSEQRSIPLSPQPQALQSQRFHWFAVCSRTSIDLFCIPRGPAIRRRRAGPCRSTASGFASHSFPCFAKVCLAEKIGCGCPNPLTAAFHRIMRTTLSVVHSGPAADMHTTGAVPDGFARPRPAARGALLPTQFAGNIYVGRSRMVCGPAGIPAFSSCSSP